MAVSLVSVRIQAPPFDTTRSVRLIDGMNKSETSPVIRSSEFIDRLPSFPVDHPHDNHRLTIN